MFMFDCGIYFGYVGFVLLLYFDEIDFVDVDVLFVMYFYFDYCVVVLFLCGRMDFNG